MPEMFIAAALLLVTVMVLALLVEPTSTLVKDKLAGEKVNEAVVPEEPVPDSATLREPAPYAMDNAPSIIPSYVGLKVTVIVHFFFASKLVLQGEAPLPAAV
jgi:hypothetical protein